jgi:regulator of sirC expression with transglutaminase-like and TPR domain
MAAAGSEHRRRLAQLGQAEDEDFPPLEAALLLAALERPRANLAGIQDFLDELGDEVRLAAKGGGAQDWARALTRVVLDHHRFRADDGDNEDPADTNLLDVIERRQGVQDALGLILLGVAGRAGLMAQALAFPSHFLLRIEDGAGRRVILYPAASGQVVSTPELRALIKSTQGLGAELDPGHYQPLGNREVVVRLQNGAKVRHLRLGRLEAALAVIEATLLAAPDQAMLWREAGLLHMRLDHTLAAVQALEQFLARTTNAQARARTQAMLAELQTRLH